MNMPSMIVRPTTARELGKRKKDFAKSKSSAQPAAAKIATVTINAKLFSGDKSRLLIKKHRQNDDGDNPNQ
jgi:hypothetical protein